MAPRSRRVFKEIQEIAICRWRIIAILLHIEGGFFMDILKLKLTELNVPEKNVRIHTEKQLQEYERSVRMFGQIRPIVVDEKNTILAGRGLYETLKRMGEETAECYRYENLTENQKKKLMIADNKIFSLGVENLDTLNEFLIELQDDLEIPGFDEEILRQMVSDADEVTDKISQYGTLDDEEIRHIQAKAERMDQHADRMQAQAPVESVYDPPTAEGEAQRLDNENTTEDRKFVICSNCGAKIWL